MNEPTSDNAPLIVMILLLGLTALAYIGWTQREHVAPQGEKPAPVATVPEKGDREIETEQFRLDNGVPCVVVFVGQANPTVSCGWEWHYDK